MIVWLASYPKSGNTWLRLALRSLAAGGGPIHINQRDELVAHAAGRHPFDTLLDVDSSDLLPAEVERARLWLNAGRDGMFKVHDAFSAALFPAGDCRVVYIVRDPRDVAVSLAHHLACAVDEVIGHMADPGYTFASPSDRLKTLLPQRLGTWSGHVAGWLDSGLPLLCLRYEDMAERLAAVAEFVGMVAPPEAVAGALAATAFETVRAQEERAGFIERPEQAERFFRRGVAGGWRDSLTPGQAARVEADHGQVMRRLGYLP